MVTAQEYATSNHEAGHALRAHVLGLEVQSVTMRPTGTTTFLTPFTPRELPQRLKAMPNDTAVIMQAIVSSILAGSMADQSIIGGQDALELAAWRTAWEKARAGATPTAPTWAYLCTCARADTLIWLAQEDTKRALGVVARALRRAGSLDAGAWQTLVRETMARPRPTQVVVPPVTGAARSPQTPRALPPGRSYIPAGPLPDWRTYSPLQGVWA